MALQTINTIQNPESYKAFIEKYFEDTLEDTLQALANSGNRIGVAGASIKSNSYSIFDVISDLDINSEDKSNYAIKIEYTGTQYKYQLYDIENSKNVDDNNVNYISESNTIDLSDEDIYLTIKNKILVFFGHIDDISKNSIIHKKDDILTCIFKCHIINTDNDAEYLYFQYDTNKNVLINFIDVKQYNDRYYILYKLEYQGIEDKTKHYSFDAHLFKLSGDKNDETTLESYIKKFVGNNFLNINLNKLFKYDSNLNDEDTNNFSFLNPQFANFEVLCNVEYIYNASSIVQFILNHNPLTDPEFEIYHFNIGKEYVEYHQDESMYFSPDAMIHNEILNKINLDDINEFLWIGSAINELYKYLLEIYNSNYYISSKKQLFINIIKALYSCIYKAYGNNSTKTALYIPSNIRLNYLSSDVNELKIMYINTIDVIHWNGTDIELSNDHITYYDESIENKIGNYSIIISYNNTYSDVINDINAYKIYTYPYINKLNSWIINDVDTNISSYNELLSLNKFIFLYCDNFEKIENTTDLSYYITNLSNIQDQDLRYFEEYDIKEFIVNSDYFPSYKKDIIKCRTIVPKITSINKNYFENVTLLIVTDKNNLIEVDENTDYSSNYDGNYIFSLWKYSSSSEKNEFIPIIDPKFTSESKNSYVFDPFGWKSTNSEFSNNILYVKANNKKTAQDPDTIIGYDYVVLRNKLSDDYNEILQKQIGESDNPYENNLNFIIECVNNFNKSGKNPNYPDNKYIEDTGSVITSNVLYPVYNFDTVVNKTIDVYEEEASTVKELINDETLNLYTYNTNDGNDNKTWLISQQYIKTIEKEKMVSKYIPYQQDITSLVTTLSNTERYNEFIPDKNDIPSFDFKEILNRNVNILNRVNILGLDSNTSSITNNSDKRWYNGFFGTYFDKETSKSILGISTNSTNINVGTDTLFDLENVSRFNLYDTFRIDNFKTIEFKAFNNIEVSKPVISKMDFGEYKTKSISCIPIGRFYNLNNDAIHINVDFDENTQTYSIRNISKMLEFIGFNEFDGVYNDDRNSILNDYLFIQGGIYKNTTQQTGNEWLTSFKMLYLNNIIVDKFGIEKSIIDNLNYKNIICGNNLLLCISFKNNIVPVENIDINSISNDRNYFFLVFADQEELNPIISNEDNINDNIYIYNHLLNMSMIKYRENEHKFYISFDDKKLNDYNDLFIKDIINQFNDKNNI